MKIKVWTVTSETNAGLESSVFLSESEALAFLFNVAIVRTIGTDDAAALRAAFDDDPSEVIFDHGNSDNSYNWESHELEIPDETLSQLFFASLAEETSTHAAGVM